MQNTRTPDRSEQAKKDASLSLNLFFSEIDPAITAKNDPKLFLLFQKVHNVDDQVNGAAKARYNRPRPFVAHGDVIHPLGTVGGTSYPSGHSTVVGSMAVILAQIFPTKADQIDQIGDRIAESRVVMGVHYTTDIKEGEADGKEIAQELLTKSAFQQALAEVKAEVAQQNPVP